MAEDPFVEEALRAASETLREPLLIRRAPPKTGLGAVNGQKSPRAG